MHLRFGLIGYGAIGKAVARAAQAGEAGDVTLAAILARSPERVAGVDCPVTNVLERFLEVPFDLTVEVAGHEALRKYGEAVLRAGRDLLTLSVGALADEALAERLRVAAQNGGRRVILPSGAIGALDYLSAAAVGKLNRVTLVTRKPPEAWRGTAGEAKLRDISGTEAVCLFSGSAREAARLFPQNVNVASALGLAGIGLDRTEARIYADPSVTRNTHEISAEGEFGRFTARFENEPSPDNPKTGRIASMSVIKTLRHLSGHLLIGI